MRNFLLFIRRFFNLILFLALEVFCAVIITRTNTLQGNDLLNSSNTVTGFIYQRQSALVYYFGLGSMNDSLLRENARLHTQIDSTHHMVDVLKDSAVRRRINTGDTLHPVQYADYIYRTARVINNSIVEKNNFITINRGSDDGIAVDMAVLSGTGIVGKIVHVSAHYATAISMLSDMQVSAKLKDNTTSLVTWGFGKTRRNPDIIYMSDVPQEVKLRLGDSVFTTSYSLVFPPDVLVGIVAHVDIIKKTNKRLLTLKPSTNFRNMQYVYVVENTKRPEQAQLELQNAPAAKKEGKKK